MECCHGWSVAAAHGGTVTLNVGKNGKVTRTTLMGERDELTVPADTGTVSVPIGENIILLSSDTLPTAAAG